MLGAAGYSVVLGTAGTTNVLETVGGLDVLGTVRVAGMLQTSVGTCAHCCLSVVHCASAIAIRCLNSSSSM